jgi:predicted transcriptional regulator of viral defense system
VSQVDKIIELAKRNNGIVTSAMISKNNINRGFLNYLCKRGKLEKTTRGVYILPDIWEDEFFNLQARFKKGVFSHETALYLLDLTDRTPMKYDMTFPATYNLTMAKKHFILCHQSKKDIYEKGIIQTQSPSGNELNIYCAEKTLCDILRPHANTDIQIISQAFKQYSNSNLKNIPLLSEFAKELKVIEKVRSYLEVLL